MYEVAEGTVTFQREPVPALFARLPQCNTFSLIVSFHDGVAFEEDDEWGMAHFLEHLTLQGTPEYPSLTALSGVLEAQGGKISAFSTRDTVSYWAKVPSWALDDAFTLLGKVLAPAEFDDGKVASERSIVFSEIDRESSTFRLSHGLMAEGSLMAPSRISRYPLGSRESLGRFTAGQCAAYRKRVYCSENAFISGAGSYEESSLKRGLEGLVEALPCGEARERRDEKVHMVRRAPFSRFECPGISQVNLVAGWLLAMESDEQWVVAGLLNTLLGTGFTSLLYRALREERRLTYLVSTQLRFYRRTGTFRISLDVKPEDAGEALEVIGGVIEKVKRGAFSGEELKAAQARMWGSLVLRLEDTYEYALFLNRRLGAAAGPMRLREVKDAIFSIEGSDLADCAASLLIDDRMLVSAASSREALDKITIRKGGSRNALERS
ncbi:MAG: pitrilysin family protein [Candidatus Eremiobacteraeota bacterium]|nr:pitrilysin family protein [Candidatus Eremiobacteraeota bacterium]